jgi:hypothetical protein
MPVLLLRILLVATLAYIAGSTITPLMWASAVKTQAEQTLSPFMLLSGGVLLLGVGYAVKQLFHR